MTRAICLASASSTQRGLRRWAMPWRASTLLIRAIGACTVTLLSCCSDGAAGSCGLRWAVYVCRATGPGGWSVIAWPRVRSRRGAERNRTSRNPQAGPPHWGGRPMKKAAPGAAPRERYVRVDLGRPGVPRSRAGCSSALRAAQTRRHGRVAISGEGVDHSVSPLSSKPTNEYAATPRRGVTAWEQARILV